MSNQQIIDEASEWFVALREPTVDAAVHQRFLEWLRRSPEHVRAYLGVTTLWADLAAMDPTRTPDQARLIDRARAEINVIGFATGRASVPAAASKAGAPSTRRILLAAAATVCAFVLAAGWWYVRSTSIYKTEIGEQRLLKLADGSTVQLNSGSRIRVRYSDTERAIDLLVGQALFHVAKDEQKPFIVRSDDAVVRAVGTQFDVYRKQGSTVVTVVEGRVSVSHPSDKSAALPSVSGDTAAASMSAFVSAGEQVSVTARARPHAVATNVAEVTAWTQGKLMFKSTPLSSVVEEFNRYNTRRLILASNAPEIPITAVFSSTDTQMLVEFLKDQPEFRIVVEPHEVRIEPRLQQ